MVEKSSSPGSKEWALFRHICGLELESPSVPLTRRLVLRMPITMNKTINGLAPSYNLLYPTFMLQPQGWCMWETGAGRTHSANPMKPDCMQKALHDALFRPEFWRVKEGAEAQSFRTQWSHKGNHCSQSVQWMHSIPHVPPLGTLLSQAELCLPTCSICPEDACLFLQTTGPLIQINSVLTCYKTELCSASLPAAMEQPFPGHCWYLLAPLHIPESLAIAPTTQSKRRQTKTSTCSTATFQTNKGTTGRPLVVKIKCTPLQSWERVALKYCRASNGELNQLAPTKKLNIG